MIPVWKGCSKQKDILKFKGKEKKPRMEKYIR